MFSTYKKPANIRSLSFAAVLLAAVATSCFAAAEPAPAPLPADTIMSAAHIKTPSGWAESLAIRDGVIVALGDTQTVDALRGPQTRSLNLNGRTVLPGLFDVHVHPLFGGLTEQECKISQGSTLSETRERVRTCAGRAEPEAWVTGGQWDAPALGRIPDRKLLDAVSLGRPVMLDDTSGHSSWANSRALAIAGITARTPNPPGGIIERDAAGNPTGILREAAADLVRTQIPKPDEAAVRAALEWSLHTMLSYGITSFTEASVGFAARSETELKVYAALADTGILKQHATLCLTWAPGSEEADEVIAMRNLYARARVAPDCVKIFLDGVPTDSHTAAMLEPYTGALPGRDDEASRRGMLLVKQDVLNEAVTRFDRMGLTVKFHAAGDAAVRAGLDAIAAARRANGFSGQMHNVGHCTFVAKEDIARARAIGATFEVSPYLWGPTPINDSITAAVGDELIRRVWPVRELIDSGALVVPGSDWSVVPSVNPWIGIETLVTREVPGGSARSFGKAEAITLPEAMDLFTVNAAKQARASNKVGRIEVGMQADLIVVDRNPYEVPITQVHDTHVAMTFIGGELVFERK
jgi:predicted amidohydrolase YtcJ